MTVDVLGHDFNPLFMLLKTKDWKAAVAHVEKEPRSADGTMNFKAFYDQKGVSTRVNALHIACNSQAPLSVIEALLKANSKLASEKESTYQRLPLHIATLKQCPMRIVSAVLNTSPKSARVQDVHGRLPIHYASKDHKNGERTLRCLLKVYPESVKIADDNGFLPLHVACRAGMPMPIINMMLRIAPETVLAITNSGATPVHCAKNVKGKGDMQELIVETLTQFALETQKLVGGKGGSPPLVGSSHFGAFKSSVPSLKRAVVPDMVSLSNHSATASGSDDSSATDQ